MLPPPRSASCTSPPTRSTAASGPPGLFTETTPYAPNSPYAASKAAADHFVRAYHDVAQPLTTNCSNNYGPYQYPEKLIPLLLLNALDGQPLPIYGDGGNVRDWLYVEDHREAILLALERGRGGERYNVGAHNERTNLEVVEQLCAVLERERPAASNLALAGRGIARYADLKTFSPIGRATTGATPSMPPGHATRAGWAPRHDFADGLRRPCAVPRAPGLVRRRAGRTLRTSRLGLSPARP